MCRSVPSVNVRFVVKAGIAVALEQPISGRERMALCQNLPPGMLICIEC